MFSPGPAVYAGLAVAYTFYRWHKRRRAYRALPLPPGPKGLPLVGNLYDIPATFEWEQYARWSEGYSSDIIYLNVAGISIVVVNSHGVAMDLFEKRSSIYSSRHGSESTMIKEVAKLDWIFGLMKYAEPWKEHRKMFQQHFHPLNTERYQPKEQDTVGAITIAIAYGLDIGPSSNTYIEIAEKGLIAITSAGAPGAFLVDAIPVLKYVPSWFPGASFKRKGLVWRKWATTMVEVPFYDAEEAVAAGTANPASFVPTCLSNLDKTEDVGAQKRLIMDTAGNFFVGGADTSVASIAVFVLQMTLHPDIQAKAHAELDRVVGKNTLPTFADELALPYIGAILKEILRWHTITPLAIPHFVTEDDEYDGYFIPKNSVVIGNAWAMLHDRRDYDDPFTFRPERFLTPDGSQLDPNIRDPSAAFGFGRRICPGRHMATSMLYIAVASILSVFEISKARDEDGKPITPSGECLPSLVSHPVPFRCSIKPRSSEAEKVIMAL